MTMEIKVSILPYKHSCFLNVKTVIRDLKWRKPRDLVAISAEKPQSCLVEGEAPSPGQLKRLFKNNIFPKSCFAVMTRGKTLQSSKSCMKMSSSMFPNK